jgi:hypothetical protein
MLEEAVHDHVGLQHAPDEARCPRESCTIAQASHRSKKTLTSTTVTKSQASFPLKLTAFDISKKKVLSMKVVR